MFTYASRWFAGTKPVAAGTQYRLVNNINIANLGQLYVKCHFVMSKDYVGYVVAINKSDRYSQGSD